MARQLVGEAALEGARVGQAEAVHQGAAGVVAFPAVGGAFVASDVDVRIGEEVGHLVEDVFHEAQRGRAGHVQEVTVAAGDVAVAPQAVWAVGVAGELRIGRHGGGAVSGKFDFGDDFDVAFAGVGHDVAHLFLRVVGRAVAVVVEVEPVGRIDVPRALPFGADGREAWVFLYLQAPALVVGEVPVKAVHLIGRHDVEHAFDLVYTEKVAAHVEHEPAVGEAGRVGDVAGRDRGGCLRVVPSGGHVGRHEAGQRLEGVEETGGGGGCHRDAAGRDVEAVALRPAGGVVVAGGSGAGRAADDGGRGVGRGAEGQVAGAPDESDETQRLGAEAVGELVAGYSGTGRETEAAFGGGIVRRTGDEVLRGSRLRWHGQGAEGEDGEKD